MQEGGQEGVQVIAYLMIDIPSSSEEGVEILTAAETKHNGITIVSPEGVKVDVDVLKFGRTIARFSEAVRQ